MKAFLFTLDALVALSIMIIISTSVFVYSQQKTSDARLVELNQLGYDYLKMWAGNESNLRTDAVAQDYLDMLNAKTGLNFSTTKPADGKVIARSVAYVYPPVCGLTGAYPSEQQNLELSEADFDKCVNDADKAQNHLNESKREIWVVVP